MKIEKRNNHKKKIIIGGMIVTSVLTVGIFTSSYSKYRVTESIKLGEGIINYTGSDFEVVGMYIINKDGSETEIVNVPDDGYILNEEKTKCTVNNIEISASIEYKDNKLYFGNITEKGTKCQVYFEIKPKASDTILGNVTVKPGTDSFTGPATTAEDSGLFSTQDDDGTTYYYRGIHNSVNNWVDFAGFKWRILRINGDGSIRMIYNGTSTATTGTGTQIGANKFNGNSNNNMYVGFRYTNGQVHGTETPSTILGADNSTDTATLNGWYNTKIKGTQYEKYIAKNAGFCNDRIPSTSNLASNGQGGTGTIITYYGPRIRLISGAYEVRKNQTVTMKCNESDLFTSKLSNKENKSLENPIGLITSDEVVYAGGFGGTVNQQYWLCTGQSYWTMSPTGYFSQVGVNGFSVNYSGDIYSSGITAGYGVRPVINLRSDIELTGTGTTTDPYKIVE